MLIIEVATSSKQIEAVRKLLYTYGASRDFDKALGDYETELASLPGKYGPPEGYLLLASLNGEAAGCIAYRKIGEGICEMKRMYVSDAFRGQGIGRQLVKVLLEAAKAMGYHTMKLDTHPTMISAHNLYQSLGFVEIERYNDNPIPGVRFFGLTL